MRVLKTSRDWRDEVLRHLRGVEGVRVDVAQTFDGVVVEFRHVDAIDLHFARLHDEGGRYRVFLRDRLTFEWCDSVVASMTEAMRLVRAWVDHR